MSVVNLIFLTAFSTAVAIALGVLGYRVFRGLTRYARELLAAVRMSAEATRSAVQVVTLVREELAYMRQFTQGQVQVQQDAPEPPLGRAGKMPPAFPQHWTVPDAKPEDTDRSLLEQTDQEVLEAQGREEMRAGGIEPDDDGLPADAVVEQV